MSRPSHAAGPGGAAVLYDSGASPLDPLLRLVLLALYAVVPAGVLLVLLRLTVVVWLGGAPERDLSRIAIILAFGLPLGALSLLGMWATVTRVLVTEEGATIWYLVRRPVRLAWTDIDHVERRRSVSPKYGVSHTLVLHTRAGRRHSFEGGEAELEALAWQILRRVARASPTPPRYVIDLAR